MRKISQIYEQYQIMPQLATHMLRVAGVGRIVAEAWRGEVDTDRVTKLCLVHDLGNVVKFRLEEEDLHGIMADQAVNLEYWRRVQRETWEKYGKDAHVATKAMLTEGGLTHFNQYLDEENKLYFTEPRESELASASVEAIILMYADCRVKPQGVVSYRERIDDLKKRYGGVKSATWYDWIYWFEEWVQEHTKVDVLAITESAVTPLFTELLGYNV